MKRMFFSAVLALCWLTQAGCAGNSGNTSPQSISGTVVVWISIDGMRHDYVARDSAHLPTFQKMVEHGERTEALVPVFPSLTFPSHTSEATGVTPGVHGIVANTFYDPNTKSMYSFPDDSSLIQAEPIWNTATRQHVRTAVIDWPMSYQQRGPDKCDYFEPSFNKDATDAQRLDRLLQVWRDDDPAAHGGQPLRLLIGYIADIDKAGHKYGPDGQGLHDQLVKTDGILGDFVSRATEIFKSKMKPSDRLFFVFTTDHGMTNDKNLVNLEHLIGKDSLEWAHVVTSGSLANIYLDDVPDAKRAAQKAAILEHARKWPFIEAWSRDELPKKYGYDQNARAGDVIISLKPGYTWSKKPKEIVEASSGKGQLGMHGYPVEEEPDMLGFAVIYSPQENLGGKNLGEVDSLRLHPTVATLLGIHPAPGAKAPPILIEMK